jgi:hypothetical protein
MSRRSRTRKAPGGAGAGRPHDPLWQDAGSLVDIARRHAAFALAGPAEARDSRLDACRLVWILYAAALGARPAIQVRFADELQDVTRTLMAAQQRSGGASPESAAERPLVPGPQAAETIITIEELRPLVQQIIRA